MSKTVWGLNFDVQDFMRQYPKVLNNFISIQCANGDARMIGGNSTPNNFNWRTVVFPDSTGIGVVARNCGGRVLQGLAQGLPKYASSFAIEAQLQVIGAIAFKAPSLEE
ncbi:hypothetical protein M9H77_23027 [Catharanthus roseus]|uniref:Uncharacterized protein n=1 Tax=Catharanthus roseus TaxID=4058 RepID=A0ACC0AUA4_CATRO|nr:hypothetical protein M9H77_23027 [Catharanthus roseus]